MTGPRIRQAVRALLLDEDDHVLLVNFRWEGLDPVDGFWACPGGGIEPGESPEQALRRELHEELGLEQPIVLGPVWRLTRLFAMLHWEGQTDLTYLVRCSRFQPEPRVDLAAEGVHGLRWFSPVDVAAGVVTFSPRDLAAHLGRVLDQGLPDEVPEIPALG
ncbi:NUDIX domain-containing protein [Nocardioides sp.]|uniref:NUDIX hydrolase n=1 Tax=Nocardioides sp. TaxID=35761 RepID=UPI00286A225C|nr:NUDIX domain-containing protein [Nocardioides sp.]